MFDLQLANHLITLVFQIIATIPSPMLLLKFFTVPNHPDIKYWEFVNLLLL